MAKILPLFFFKSKAFLPDHPVPGCFELIGTFLTFTVNLVPRFLKNCDEQPINRGPEANFSDERRFSNRQYPTSALVR